MTPADYQAIANAIHEAAYAPMGRTALIETLAQMAEKVADVFAKDKKFDRLAFIRWCGFNGPLGERSD
jgi:hypothetical protein